MNLNKEIEQAVLGALLIEPEALTEVAPVLTVETFTDTFHQVVFAAILQLARNNQPIDYLSVGEIIKKHLPENETVISELVALTQHVASAGHIKHHALILKDLQVKREITATAEVLRKKAEEGADVEELIYILKKQTESIEANSVTEAPVSLKEALKDVAEELRAPESNGLTTGFVDLDKFFGGLKSGRVYVLAGRPGQGKTSVALFSAIENVKKGAKVLFFSAEQDVPDLTKKILGGEAGIGHQRLDRGNLSADEWSKIDAAIGQIEQFPGDLLLKTWPKNIQEIAAIIRNTKKKTGLDLAFIDYLQLIPGMKKGEYREREVAEVSRTIKQIAMTEKIPIVALSQLNRQGTGEPSLHHLRESGAIEQDADAVMFVYRPSLEGDKEERPDLAKILIKKNRRGQLGEFEFYHRNMNQFDTQPFEAPPAPKIEKKENESIPF